MRHAHVVANERLPHQGSWGGAFGEGLRRHGWDVTHAGTPARCELLVMWGVRRRDWIAAQARAGGEVCVLERGYVGDRFAWASVSFGGDLNGRAEFCGPFHDGSRWERHFAHLMQPWRTAAELEGGYALVLGQVPGDASLGGRDLAPWYLAAARALHAQGWPVRFRPHPIAVQRRIWRSVPGARTLDGSLTEALAGAARAATYNSNAAVDAVLAGVPTIAMDKGSMAWPVTAHEIGPSEIATPDRTAWAHRLAWCQWTMEEMRSGDCWAAVGGNAWAAPASGAA
jgi:hypothetical protein